MALNVFQFLDRYPNYEDKDYLQSFFNCLTRWGDPFVCIFQDDYNYNQSWETPDGLFWSVFIVRNNKDSSIMPIEIENVPNYSCKLVGIDDCSFTKDCDTILEALNLYKTLQTLEPLKLDELTELGFYFSN